MNNNHAGTASIIILTRNGLDYLRQCLESVFHETTYPDYEIIVVDNASEDGTLEYLDDIRAHHPNLQILRNERNLGFARGNNQGAFVAKGQYLVFLNNDTVVTPGWLTGLIKHLQDPSIGMIGPVTNYASNEAKIRITYDSIKELNQFASEYTQAHFGGIFEIRTLAFFCVVMRAERFHEIGPLDERFGLGMFEDDDYAMRMKSAGYKVVCTEDVFIHHWGGVSFSKLDPYQYWLLFKENRRKFEEKWHMSWQPHLHRADLLSDQVIQLSEWSYRLQWQLLTESQTEKTDQSFSIVVDRLIEQEHTIERLSATVEDIYKSNAWKLVRLLWNIRSTLFPDGSQRAAFLTRIMGKSKPPSARTPVHESPTAHTQTSATESQGRASNLRVELPGRQIVILAPQFFDHQGQSIYMGGAERYLIELVKINRELNIDTVVYQSAIGEWEREYLGIPFYGLNTHGNAKKLNVLFHNLISENTPVIYLAFNLAAPYHSNCSVGISHGIYWDHEIPDSVDEHSRAIDFILASISNLSRIVSVDTNTINWLRTIQPTLAEKCVYIPNFVDVNKFKPAKRSRGEELVVLYPRRLNLRRGFWMVHELVPKFLATYPELKFHFIGQADTEEQSAVEELVRNYPRRVLWKTIEMQNMHQVYQGADITLIPSVYSEGTSLSCLEAMASGNAVIASNIGGLPDLVISGYNGLLIDPGTSALREALSILINDPEMRQQLGKRAQEVAGTFNINNWQSKWKKILSEVLL